MVRGAWENQDRQGRFESMVLDTSENIDAIVILASWYPIPRVDAFFFCLGATRLINAGLGTVEAQCNGHGSRPKDVRERTRVVRIWTIISSDVSALQVIHSQSSFFNGGN
jgi:hypothetical protein